MSRSMGVFACRPVAWSSTRLVVVAPGLGLPSETVAQPSGIAPRNGLFLPLGGGLSGEVRGALAGTAPGGVQGGDAAPAGVIRSRRRVAIDFSLLGERVEGLLGRPDVDPGRGEIPPLVLNFFDDASVEMSVDAVEPAVLGDGYVVSGSVPGQPGSIVLVVHAGNDDRVVAVSGSATTAEGAFRVSTVGGGTYAIEEIDTAVPWVDGVLPDEPESLDPPPPGAGDAAFSRVDPAVSADASGVSEIDVLVLYTPAAAVQAGGEASMRAQVELLFGETNMAFRGSGVSARVGRLGAHGVVRGKRGYGHRSRALGRPVRRLARRRSCPAGGCGRRSRSSARCVRPDGVVRRQHQLRSCFHQPAP